MTTTIHTCDACGLEVSGNPNSVQLFNYVTASHRSFDLCSHCDSKLSRILTLHEWKSKQEPTRPTKEEVKEHIFKRWGGLLKRLADA